MSDITSTSSGGIASVNATNNLRPTHVRWHIVVLLAIIAGLTYLDRLNLGIAGKHIQDEFAFSTETMGWVLSAFVLGYALLQVPGGWLGDRLGPRAVLTAAILVWSVFTAVTAVAPRLPVADWFGLAWSFAIIRFFVGVGEGMAFPNINRMVAFWMAPAERGVGNSFWILGIGVGGMLTPMFIAWLAESWGWRISFYICALLGGFVALAWRLYVTNHPEEHRRVNVAELALIRGTAPASSGPTSTKNELQHRTPWGKMLSSGSIWALFLSYFCIAYPAYIFYTWFFIYLVRVRGLTVTQGGFWGATPFIAITLLTPLGGWVSDRAVSKFGKRRGRQVAVWLGTAVSAILMWIGGHTENNTLAILLLAGAAGFNLFATTTWWATCNDLTRNFAGSLSGLMNMFGNLGGFLAPIVTAYLATRLGWTQALGFAALVTLAAGLLWVLVKADQPLEEDPLPQ
jgi:ACS family glucarate transporter-like MFS transporter